MKFSEVKASLLSLGQTGFIALLSQSLFTMQMSIKHPLAAAPNRFSIEKSSTLEPSLNTMFLFMIKMFVNLANYSFIRVEKYTTHNMSLCHNDSYFRMPELTLLSILSSVNSCFLLPWRRLNVNISLTKQRRLSELKALYEVVL